MKFRVLLVDDEVDFISPLAERLRLRGIGAEIATNGYDALKKIETDPPQVIVLDVLMPGISGLELLKRIKRQFPQIPVILLTGRSSWDSTQGIRLGAYDCLMKPLKIEELIPILSEAANFSWDSGRPGNRYGPVRTFTHLIQEVQEKGLCHHCGGCVAFCTAIKYGALEVGEDGRPRYRELEKCIKCGICYSICPEIHELDEDTKNLVSWSPPMGHLMGIAVARSTDPEVRARGTDGGVVTALLLHLFDRGYIDAAIVSKTVSPFQRQPWLALSREDIIAAAGFHFDTLPSLAHLSEVYSTYSPSIMELQDVANKPFSRVAFVGTPCQINTVRRMQVLGVVPSDVIKFHFGLFCSGTLQFDLDKRHRLEKIGNFTWAEVFKVNLKEELLIHLHNREIRSIPLDRLAFMKRYACQFCDDYGAEFADISFGGLGAPGGWTTVIIRSPVGMGVMAQARWVDIELLKAGEKRSPETQALAKVFEWSEKKKQTAAEKFQELEMQSI